MVRMILKYLTPIVLGVVVFLTAKYLDGNPISAVVETNLEQVQTEQAMTEATEAEKPENTEIAEPETAAPPVEETEPVQQRYVLTFAGDCTLGGVPENVAGGMGFLRVVGENYTYPLQNVRPWFEEDDCTFVNLEGPLTDTGYPIRDALSFWGVEAYSAILTEGSVEFASLSNDHIHDYGDIGYQNTQNVLEKAGIFSVERDKTSIITLENGLTIGVYGALLHEIKADTVKREIAALRESGVDVVIFVPHWGYENTYMPRTEDKALAYAAIDAGADIVFGTHPRVLQPVEQYHDGIILYSVGSLCVGGYLYPEDMDTALIQVTLTRDADGRIFVESWDAVPCSISSEEEWNNFQPTPYAAGSKEYQRVMSKLEGTWKASDRYTN